MPLKRLHHFLRRQEVALDAPLAIISHDGEDVAYPSHLPWRPVQRILDRFHIGLRFEHVLQRLRGLSKSGPEGQRPRCWKRVESAKWRLWHGRATGCLEQLEAIQEGCSGMLLTRVAELVAYLQRNKARLIHYAQRYRLGLPISTSAAESSLESVVGDRFKKNCKMRWTPKGANALLHLRVADLNAEPASALNGDIGCDPNRRTTADGPAHGRLDGGRSAPDSGHSLRQRHSDGKRSDPYCKATHGDVEDAVRKSRTFSNNPAANKPPGHSGRTRH